MEVKKKEKDKDKKKGAVACLAVACRLPFLVKKAKEPLPSR